MPIRSPFMLTASPSVGQCYPEDEAIPTADNSRGMSLARRILQEQQAARLEAPHLPIAGRHLVLPHQHAEELAAWGRMGNVAAPVGRAPEQEGARGCEERAHRQRG